MTEVEHLLRASTVRFIVVDPEASDAAHRVLAARSEHEQAGRRRKLAGIRRSAACRIEPGVEPRVQLVEVLR